MWFAFIEGKKFSVLYIFQQLDENEYVKILGYEIFNIFFRIPVTFGKFHVKTEVMWNIFKCHIGFLWCLQ